jgi:microcystin-dependent protein
MKTTWAHDTKITTTNMNNAETQYDDGYLYFLGHTHDTLYYTKSEMQSQFWYAGNDGAGSGFDADKIYHSSGNMEYTDFIASGLATGVIAMYHGSVAPAGWHLCDGSDGTRDLRGQFVIGAGGAYSPGATGGAASIASTNTLNVATHVLTDSELPTHSHSFTDTHNPYTMYGGYHYSIESWGNQELTFNGTTSYIGGSQAHGHSGSTVTTTATENRPASIVITYIQKT